MRPNVEAGDELLSMPEIPASSRSILELLLRQCSMPSNPLHRRLYDMVHCLDDTESTILDTSLDDHDAVIFHNIDALFGHYAPRFDKTDPFSSWRGAGEKGDMSRDFYGSSYPKWLVYYLTKVLKMEPVETEAGIIYKGGVKMKRGHKVASCLLKWARTMQLGSSKDQGLAEAYHGSELLFDHEQMLRTKPERADATSFPRHNQHTYFVSEVVR